MSFYKRVNQAYALRAKRVSRTITHTDLTDGDPQQQFDFAAALPTNAFILGAYINVTVQFSDGAAGTATMDLGINGGNTDAFLDAADVSTATGIVNEPKGAVQTGFYGGETPTIIVDGTVNLDTFNAGSATLYILYTDITNIQS